jgi:putative peptide zinc metalloprotease protein
MRRHTRPLAGSLLAAALLLGVAAAPAGAQETQQPPAQGGSGGDNAVVAINTHDGFDLFKLGFKISRATGNVVDASNGAVAFSSCTECQTVAIAYQVVLIFSDPQVVTPENIAIAFNYQCELCESLAYAYQFVLTTGGPVHFTAEGNRLLAELRRELQALRNADLTLEELVAKLKDIARRLEQIIRTELVSAGPPPEVDVALEPTPGESPSPSPAPSPSPSEPEASPSPSPTGETP